MPQRCTPLVPCRKLRGQIVLSLKKKKKKRTRMILRFKEHVVSKGFHSNSNTSLLGLRTRWDGCGAPTAPHDLREYSVRLESSSTMQCPAAAEVVLKKLHEGLFHCKRKAMCHLWMTQSLVQDHHIKHDIISLFTSLPRCSKIKTKSSSITVVALSFLRRVCLLFSRNNNNRLFLAHKFFNFVAQFPHD